MECWHATRDEQQGEKRKPERSGNEARILNRRASPRIDVAEMGAFHGVSLCTSAAVVNSALFSLFLDTIEAIVPKHSVVNR